MQPYNDFRPSYDITDKFWKPFMVLNTYKALFK